MQCFIIKVFKAMRFYHLLSICVHVWHKFYKAADNGYTINGDNTYHLSINQHFIYTPCAQELSIIEAILKVLEYRKFSLSWVNM